MTGSGMRLSGIAGRTWSRSARRKAAYRQVLPGDFEVMAVHEEPCSITAYHIKIGLDELVGLRGRRGRDRPRERDAVTSVEYDSRT